MAANDFLAETPENFEQKCLCVLVLDVSGSMIGTPIQQLNEGLQRFKQQVMNDEIASQRLEVCVITFSGRVACIQEPSLIHNFDMPTLKAGGSTALVDGLRRAILKVTTRKNWYKQTGQPYYRPFVIMITDGEPDADQDVRGVSQDIDIRVDNKEFLFFPIGVQDANMDVLRQLSHRSTPPMMLRGLNFTEFFQWLSNSVSVITKSKEGDNVNLPDTSGWGQIAI